MPTAARSPLRSREASDKHYQSKGLPHLWRLLRVPMRRAVAGTRRYIHAYVPQCRLSYAIQR